MCHFVRVCSTACGCVLEPEGSCAAAPPGQPRKEVQARKSGTTRAAKALHNNSN